MRGSSTREGTGGRSGTWAPAPLRAATLLGTAFDARNKRGTTAALRSWHAEIFEQRLDGRIASPFLGLIPMMRERRRSQCDGKSAAGVTKHQNLHVQMHRAVDAAYALPRRLAVVSTSKNM